MQNTPVIIVGAGPVGLALALNLARKNIASLVLEKRLEPTPENESRAIVWMPKGLEWLKEVGQLEAFKSKALIRNHHQFRRQGKVLLDLNFALARSKENYTLNLSQHDTEVLLEEACRNQSNLIEIRRGTEVLVVKDIGTQVTLTSRNQDSSIDQLIAPYVVGCDGAKSKVREEFGLRVIHEDYKSFSAVADLECYLPKENPEVSWIDLDPARPFGLFAFGKDRWRVIYRINNKEDPKEMTSPEGVKNILTRNFPQVGPYTLLWASSFRLGQGQAEAYSKGRVILAGDAAHPMGPSAGAGMMVGILGSRRLASALESLEKIEDKEVIKRAFANYEASQRKASRSIQKTNRSTFSQITTYPGMKARWREVILPLLNRIPLIKSKIVASDTLTDLS